MSDAAGERGVLVVIVGASGAGKDSLLRSARQTLAADPDIVFQRRVITRPPGDDNEPHDSVDVAGFERLRREGELIVHWSAHGLHYGVPRACLASLAQGRVVVVNGSRAALPRFSEVFAQLRIVNVSVPLAVLAARLRARGRESEASIERRLARRVDLPAAKLDVWTLDNSGALDVAARRLTDWLKRLAATASQGAPS